MDVLRLDNDVFPMETAQLGTPHAGDIKGQNRPENELGHRVVDIQLKMRAELFKLLLGTYEGEISIAHPRHDKPTTRDYIYFDRGHHQVSFDIHVWRLLESHVIGQHRR